MTDSKYGEIPILEIDSLEKRFQTSRKIFSRKDTKGSQIRAIDNISFSIRKGEVFFLVGESGCGKTTTARVLSGLETSTSGKIKWEGESINFENLKTKKGNVKSQIVFQNPYSSLSPRIRIGEAIQHPLIIHDLVKNPESKIIVRNAKYSAIYAFLTFLISLVCFTLTFVVSGSLSFILGILGFSLLTSGLILYNWFSRKKKSDVMDFDVCELLELVGLSPPDQYYFKFPHEISGGERQRVAIARSLILNPKLLILDEPTSMLDVSLRAGILDLLDKLKEKFDISILFITHDLATARHFGDRIAIMYAGKIVESGFVDDVFNSPAHPYTHALISAIPDPQNPIEPDYIPEGEVPDAANLPDGCRFNPRCRYATDECRQKEPELKDYSSKRKLACYNPIKL